MSDVDVTVSIVNHESREGVLASLDAIVRDGDAGRRSSVEVIVVDNASQDGSVEAVRSAFPDVRVVARTDRGGYGANHNLAIRHARGRNVLLLNDDAQVQPGAIDALRDELDADATTGVAAPTVLDAADGTPMPSLWPPATPLEDVRTLLRLGRARPAAPGAVGWAMGCALMVRAQDLRNVGGFDEDHFFMYSEEVDLCARLARRGLRTVHVPGAAVVHEGQASTGDSPERAVEMSRARRAYQDLHYAGPGKLVARAAVSLTFLALTLIAVVRRDRVQATNLWLQAVTAWRDTGRPGLRERAEAFNAQQR